uniref:Uncharacterized protein n=1 Tax=Parascaris equorum TaxID=6256 RepID=A0A914RPW7_PAREQ
MYDGPLQVAAYVGAVNSDPNFSSLPTITNGAVIIAKEDGRAAHVAEMGFHDLEVWISAVCSRNIEIHMIAMSVLR